MKKKSSTKEKLQYTTNIDITDKKLEELKTKLRKQKSILKKILKKFQEKEENKY